MLLQKKQLVKQLIIVFWFLFILSGFFIGYYTVKKDFQKDSAYFRDNDICDHLILEGKLYQGEPYCSQGIFFLYTSFGLRMIFGKFVYVGVLITNLILFLISIAIISQIIMRLTKKRYLFLVCALMVFAVLPTYYAHLDTWLCGFTFLLGSYLLFFRSLGRYNAIVVGVLFTLALLSKFTVFPGVVIAIFASVIYDGQKNQFLIHRIKKKKLINAFVIALVILGFYGVLQIMYPNNLIYNIIGHQATAENSVIGTFVKLFQIKTTFLFIVENGALLLLLLYCFTYYNKIIPLLGIGYISVAFMQYKVVSVMVYPLNSYYILPYVLFIIISAVLSLHFAIGSSHIMVRRIIIGIVLLLIISTLAHMPLVQNTVFSKLHRHKDSFQSLVNGAYALLPPTNENIYLEFAEFFNPKSRLSFPAQFEFVHLQPYPPMDFGPRIQQLGIMNQSFRQWIRYRITHFTPSNQKRFDRLEESLNQLAYPYLIFGPAALSHEQQSYVGSLIENGWKASTQYCFVYVPNVDDLCEQCQHITRIYIRDYATCNQFKRDLQSYYTSIFQQLCTYDYTMVEVIEKEMFINTPDWNSHCFSGGTFVEFYDSFRFAENTYLVLILLGFCILLIVYMFRNQFGQKSKHSNKEFKILISTILFLLLLLLTYSYWTRIQSESHYLKTGEVVAFNLRSEELPGYKTKWIEDYTQCLLDYNITQNQALFLFNETTNSSIHNIANYYYIQNMVIPVNLSTPEGNNIAECIQKNKNSTEQLLPQFLCLYNGAQVTLRATAIDYNQQEWLTSFLGGCYVHLTIAPLPKT